MVKCTLNVFNYIWFHQYAFISSKPGTSVFFRILEIFQDGGGGGGWVVGRCLVVVVVMVVTHIADVTDRDESVHQCPCTC